MALGPSLTASSSTSSTLIALPASPRSAASLEDSPW